MTCACTIPRLLIPYKRVHQELPNAPDSYIGHDENNWLSVQRWADDLLKAIEDCDCGSGGGGFGECHDLSIETIADGDGFTWVWGNLPITTADQAVRVQAEVEFQNSTGSPVDVSFNYHWKIVDGSTYQTHSIFLPQVADGTQDSRTFRCQLNPNSSTEDLQFRINNASGADMVFRVSIDVLTVTYTDVPQCCFVIE